MQRLQCSELFGVSERQLVDPTAQLQPLEPGQLREPGDIDRERLVRLSTHMLVDLELELAEPRHAGQHRHPAAQHGLVSGWICRAMNRQAQGLEGGWQGLRSGRTADPSKLEIQLDERASEVETGRQPL
ncbi:hypothetical protein [Nannocystis pusilla]|uniref:hypothetical protein n=1 Tax=Nannocystis pusilla TaxID=889268 RepID=UPI003B81ABB2